MKDFLLAGGQPCPYCQVWLDGALNVEDDEGPEAGDVTICVACAGLLVFTDSLGHVRFPTDAEAVEANAHPSLRRARAAVLWAHRQKRHP